MAESKAQFKIWRASKQTQTGMMVTPDTAYMIGSKQNFIAVGQQGTTISGTVSFLTGSDQMRISGLFVGLPDFAKMIPSSTMTPLPANIPVPPLAFMASIGRSLPILLALLPV